MRLPATAADFCPAAHGEPQLRSTACSAPPKIVGYAARHAVFASVGLAGSGDAMTQPHRPDMLATLDGARDLPRHTERAGT